MSVESCCCSEIKTPMEDLNLSPEILFLPLLRGLTRHFAGVFYCGSLFVCLVPHSVMAAFYYMNFPPVFFFRKEPAFFPQPDRIPEIFNFFSALAIFVPQLCIEFF